MNNLFRSCLAPLKKSFVNPQQDCTFAAGSCMTDNNGNHLFESENGSSFYLILFIMVSLISLSGFSCSSQDSAVQNRAEKTEEGENIESVRINNVKISVGDRLDSVYDKIGRGISTIITNDPADPGNVIISHDYISGDKTYRISLCRIDKGNYHICRISPLKSSKNNRRQVNKPSAW